LRGCRIAGGVVVHDARVWCTVLMLFNFCRCEKELGTRIGDGNLSLFVIIPVRHFR
jgi:hypothetical protein